MINDIEVESFVTVHSADTVRKLQTLSADSVGLLGWCPDMSKSKQVRAASETKANM